MEENLVLESTTSIEPEEAVVENEETSTDNAQEVEVGANNTNENEVIPPFLEIKYNHESKGLSREEAVTMVQKGMHYEGIYKELERVADLKGVSVKEFISSFETEQDEAYRRELAERFGDDEETINIMMEHYQNGKQGKIDAAKSKRKQDEEQAVQNVNTRLANEFVELQKEFPELKEFGDLPESVRKQAGNGKDLTHAYLLHLHQESKKIAKAKESESKAAAQSTGTLSGSKVDDMSNDAFLKGLFSR